MATSQSQKRALDYNIKSAFLHAPEAGIIVKRNVNPGEFKSSSGEVFRLGSNEAGSRWVFRFSITDKDRIKLRKGQKAILILDALPGQQLKGNLYKMSYLPDPSTSTYDCSISFDPGTSQIIYGLTGSVSLPALSGKTLNTLPLSALSKMDGKCSRILTVDSAGIAHVKTIEIYGISNGQVAVDSTKRKVADIIVDKFPESRFLDFQYEQLSPVSYESKDANKMIESGTLKSQSRFKAAMNLHLYKRKNFVVSTSLRYKFERLEFEDMIYPDGRNNTSMLAHDHVENFHYFLGSLSFSYIYKLFGKPYVSNLSVFADGSNLGFERFNLTCLGSLVLKRNERTTMTAGIVLQTNPNAISPILPTFSYAHKFANSPWQLDLVFPQYAYVRRPLFTGGRISLGTVFDGETFFAYPNSNTFTGNYNFNQNAFKTGFLYEHRINKSFIASVRGGLNTPLKEQIREVGETLSIVTVKTGMTVYYNVGFSYNIFGKGK